MRMLKDPFFGAALPAAFPKSEKRPVVAKLGILNFYVCEWDGREAESFETEGGVYFDRHRCIEMSPSIDPSWNYLYTYTSESASRNIIYASRVKVTKETVFSPEKTMIIAQRPIVNLELDDKLGGSPCSRCKIIIDYTVKDAIIQNPLCLQCSTCCPTIGLFAGNTLDDVTVEVTCTD